MGYSISPTQPVSGDAQSKQEKDKKSLATDEKIHKKIRLPLPQGSALLGSRNAAPVPDLSRDKKKQVEVQLKKSDSKDF